MTSQVSGEIERMTTTEYLAKNSIRTSNYKQYRSFRLSARLEKQAHLNECKVSITPRCLLDRWNSRNNLSKVQNRRWRKVTTTWSLEEERVSKTDNNLISHLIQLQSSLKTGISSSTKTLWWFEKWKQWTSMFSHRMISWQNSTIPLRLMLWKITELYRHASSRSKVLAYLSTSNSMLMLILRTPMKKLTMISDP